MNYQFSGIVFLCFFLFSCGHTYKEYQRDPFTNYQWEQEQPIEFFPVIENVEKPHTLVIGLRHVWGLPLDELPVHVKIVSPSGEEQTKSYTLLLRDKKGNYISSCAGDLCDLEKKVDIVSFPEAGTYKIIVTHALSLHTVPGIMELGVILDVND